MATDMRGVFRAAWAYCAGETGTEAVADAARDYARGADTYELSRLCAALTTAWRPLAPELERRCHDEG